MCFISGASWSRGIVRALHPGGPGSNTAYSTSSFQQNQPICRKILPTKYEERPKKYAKEVRGSVVDGKSKERKEDDSTLTRRKPKWN